MTKPRLHIYAIAAAAALLLFSVLYWMTASTVHEPPATLTPLKLTSPARPVPDVVFTGPGGRLHNLHDFKGKLVVLNLWAPWCGPCVKELPALAALQRAISPDRLVVLPVDIGREGQSEAQAFLAAHGAAGVMSYVDSNAALPRAFGVAGFPVTVVIDRDGNEIGRVDGPTDWAAPASVAYFRWLASK